jgi:hypothetical protein
MHISPILCRREGCLAILIASALFVSVSPVSANDPPPQCPNLLPAGSIGWSHNLVACSEEQWESITAMVVALYPDATYSTVAYYAQVWFNLLPPELVTAPPPPAPTVVDWYEWDVWSTILLADFFPCCYLCEEQLEMWMLIFFNILPPWCG